MSEKGKYQSVKFPKKFVRYGTYRVKDPDFPIIHLNRTLAIALKRLLDMWDETKKDPKARQKLIYEIKKDEDELIDNDYLENRRSNDDQ